MIKITEELNQTLNTAKPEIELSTPCLNYQLMKVSEAKSMFLHANVKLPE